MTEKPKQGSPLNAVVGEDRYPFAGMPLTDPKNAMAETLARYLESVTFFTISEKDGKNRKWKLNAVTTNWPEPTQELNYPAASIDDQVAKFEEHNLVPTMLEETADCFGEDTVLWKTSEISVDFQVDFWTNTQADREAVRAALPRAFNPTENRAGIILQGSPHYFDRSVRVTYVSGEDLDSSEATFSRERRYRTTMRAEMDVVHLRSVKRLTIQRPTEFIDNS